MQKKILFSLAALVLLAGLILRIYNISETLMFLSDQGRDAIVLKRLVTLEKLVFVGPTTSIGNVFTGPFYYYLVAPFMAIFGLDPVGPAYGVAFINIVGMAACLYFVSRYFGQRIAFIILLIGSFSANQILQSRFSWNPNPLPIFAFGTILAFFEAQKRQSRKLFILAGLLFGLSLQLHYIAIVLPLFAFGNIAISKNLLKIGPDFKKKLTNYLIMFVVMIFTFLPLILFEVKNSFINTKTFMRASTTGEVQAVNTTFPQRLSDTAKGYLLHTYSIDIFDGYKALNWLAIAAFVMIFIAWYKRDQTSLFARGTILVILGNILALSRLETGRHEHYFNPSYFLSFFLVAYLFDTIFKAVKSKYWKIGVSILFATLLLLFIYRQIPRLSFIFEKPNRDTQLSHAKTVAKYILKQATTPMYQVVGLPFYETEGHYRYYLEILGMRPMPADSLGDPKELFVICHSLDKKDCDIPGNAQWQIADFQNRHQNWRLDRSTTKDIGHIRVYKLIY